MCGKTSAHERGQVEEAFLLVVQRRLCRLLRSGRVLLWLPAINGLGVYSRALAQEQLRDGAVPLLCC